MSKVKLRRDQEEIVRKIQEAYENGKKIVAIRAPTGYGKTIVALYSFHLLRDKFKGCLISVSKRNQLTSFIRDLYKFFDYDEVPAVALNKGDTCIRARVSEEDSEVISCNNCPFLKNFDFEFWYNSLKNIMREKISEGIYDPYKVGEELAKISVCPYKCFLIPIEFELSEYFLVTYPWISHNFIREKVLLKFYPEGFDKLFLIVDEAHNFERYVLNLNIGISPKTIERAIKELEKYIGVDKNSFDVIKLCSELYRQVLSQILSLKNEEIARLNIEINKEILDLIKEYVLKILEKKIEESKDRNKKIRIYLNSVYKFLNVLYNYGKDLVLVKEGNRLVFRRYDFSEVGKILKEFGFVVLLSATLPDKEYVSKIWEIDENLIEYIDVNKKFGRFEFRVVDIVSTKYTVRSNLMWNTYVDLIKNIIEKSENVVLVVFPSYEIMEEIYKRMGKDDIIVESKETKISDVIEEIKRGRRIIFAVAGGKLTEGIEIVDENGYSLVKDIVLVGIPYPQPTQYQSLIEKKIKEKGIDLWFFRNLQAYIKIRQAIGRGVRRVDDFCRIWLLDARYKTYWWKKKIRELE